MSRRLPVYGLALAFFLLHGVAAIALPLRLAPLSTLCVILAEVAAILACLYAARKAGGPVRILWWLLALAALLTAIANMLDMATTAMGIAVSNHAPAVPIFLSTLYCVAMLLAISMRFDLRAFGPVRIINSMLSLAIGALFYVQIFSMLTMHGSERAADAFFIVLLFDALDISLAIAGTIRALGADKPQERRFYYILAVFLWANFIGPSLHNHILLRHDFVWLDLLLSAPYLLLVALVFSPNPGFVQRPSTFPRLARVIRSGSPIFLSLALLALGLLVSRTHYYIGVAASLLSLIGYSTLTTLTQSRGIEAEESLLAAKTTLEEMVGLDALTGIPNRRAFDTMLHRECIAANRSLQPVSLLMIDVDHFKQLNDTRGHPLGDAYLIQIAHALRNALPRVTDFAARYGGEEFAVILPATNSGGAAEVARRLQSSIADLALSHAASPSGKVTISIGYSTFNGSAKTSPIDLTHAADRALYQAKERGRNRSEYLSLHEIAGK